MLSVAKIEICFSLLFKISLATLLGRTVFSESLLVQYHPPKYLAQQAAGQLGLPSAGHKARLLKG